ncbi:MAG: EAL domain-containing protein [Pseudomonadota bacterium]
MKRFFRSPLVRTSLGLVMLTVSILLVADLLGLVPNPRDSEIQSRKVIAESIAVQVSASLPSRSLSTVDTTLQSVVERNASVTSIGLRDRSGELIMAHGNHENHWTLSPGDKSVATQIRVPIYASERRWGDVELSFDTLQASNTLSLNSSLPMTLVFVCLSGFSAYLFFLKRIMRELNPDSVIPERVGIALNTLSEGLVIVDKDDNILFANSAFARKIGWPEGELTGRRSGELQWMNNRGEPVTLPWLRVLQTGESVQGAAVVLRTSNGELFNFVVNASAINASGGEVRGALVTFDDITQVEVKNAELQKTLSKLEQSQSEITRQNQALHVLATRDPLTGALNRRALFEGFGALLEEAQRDNEPLSCIMVDIDHFKSVNDRFGHAVGDKVIVLLARILTRLSRPNDLVGRFGGEEFCVVLPGVDTDGCVEVAERMRQAVERGDGARFTNNALRVTSSFGVASLGTRVTTPSELVEHADQALYAAKESGRNRVVTWHAGLAPEANTANADQADGIESGSNSANPVVVLDEERDAAELTEQPKLLLTGHNSSLDSLTLQPGTTQTSAAEDNSLPGRVLLFDRIEQSIKRSDRQATEFALVVLSLDKLQFVANTMGAAVADKLAKAAVTKLKQQLRDSDTVTLSDNEELMFSVSRLEGGELVILLSDLDSTEVLQSVLSRIMSVFDNVIVVEGNTYHLNVKAGVSVFPGDGRSPEALLKAAGSAVQVATGDDTGVRHHFYDEAINQRMMKHLRLESDLHEALDSNQLTVHYQPKVDLRNGRVLGVEALARWQHPSLGMIPPDQFISLAENNGMIEALSNRVMHAAFSQMATWKKTGLEQVTVAVNISPIEFRNPKLAETIQRILQQYDVSPQSIEVEITETIIMQDMDAAVSILRQLREMGCSIAMDDFGTGYSSLSYLKQFPLSKVKIDRSFVNDLMEAQQSAALVSAVIAMAQSLGLRVIAEGVETEEQIRYLQDLQCDEIQGYVISRPLPADEITELLSHPAAIKRTAVALLFMNEDEAQLSKLREAKIGQPHLIGTPAQIRDIVGVFEAAGVNELIVPDFTLGGGAQKRDTMDQFMAEVAGR